MRNGNIVNDVKEVDVNGSYRTYEEWKLELSERTTKSFRSSYRTYEEWKQRSRSEATPRRYVLTVPMRNGNNRVERQDIIGYQFLPYLWGMETSNSKNYTRKEHQSSYRTYEEWKLMKEEAKYINKLVLTVPMRNGNVKNSICSNIENIVLTVPMRNGNNSSSVSASSTTSVLTVPMRNGNFRFFPHFPLF